MLTKMHVYEKNNFKDYTLWEVFSEDFAAFGVDGFKILRSATKQGSVCFYSAEGYMLVNAPSSSPYIRHSGILPKTKSNTSGQIK